MYFISVSAGLLHMQRHQCTAKRGEKKCISIFTERQAVDSSGNKSTSARLHANSRATLNGETVDEKTDKNIKYSDIPFRQYQKRPDVGSWSCYHEANDRHWKEFLWIFNHIKVFYGMQINGNFFWLWRGKKHANKPYQLGLQLHKQETLSICFACLPALDACDCREINPFNNLWLKFEDFQFF